MPWSQRIQPPDELGDTFFSRLGGYTSSEDILHYTREEQAYVSDTIKNLAKTALAFSGGVTYDSLRRMTPREYEALVTGLREYREEEQRQQKAAISQSTGKQEMGGGTIRNE